MQISFQVTTNNFFPLETQCSDTVSDTRFIGHQC